jgi:3-oxoacyl-[acyl-carrier-protein] synthase III
MTTFARIVGTGSYLPEKVVTNDDLAKMVETNDEWIVSRTGIRERHYAAPHESASDLAFIASQHAMLAAQVTASEIDLIIVATSTPDMVFPATACILQDKLGVKQCIAFDVQAVCAGFVYALATAEKFIKTGASKCSRALWISLIAAPVFCLVMVQERLSLKRQTRPAFSPRIFTPMAAIAGCYARQAP